MWHYVTSVVPSICSELKGTWIAAEFRRVRSNAPKHLVKARTDEQCEQKVLHDELQVRLVSAPQEYLFVGLASLGFVLVQSNLRKRIKKSCVSEVKPLGNNHKARDDETIITRLMRVTGGLVISTHWLGQLEGSVV